MEPAGWKLDGWVTFQVEVPYPSQLTSLFVTIGVYQRVCFVNLVYLSCIIPSHSRDSSVVV